eukprot:02466.XXX_67018_67155_1 [CDS] Oithona nana genome sequencing.
MTLLIHSDAAISGVTSKNALTCTASRYLTHSSLADLGPLTTLLKS